MAVFDVTANPEQRPQRVGNCRCPSALTLVGKSRGSDDRAVFMKDLKIAVVLTWYYSSFSDAVGIYTRATQQLLCVMRVDARLPLVNLFERLKYDT